jgi:hypothetical protein
VEWNVFGTQKIYSFSWKTPAEHAAVLQYGEDFLAQFEPVTTKGVNGAMITSCICHGCPWATLELEGKTSSVPSRLVVGGVNPTIAQSFKFTIET